MHHLKSLSRSLILALAFTGACGDDEDADSGASTTAGTTSATTGASTDPATSTSPTAPTTTATTATTATTDDTTDGGGAFVFDATPPEDMVQLDRMGMPAVATAVISADLKDAYNEGTPEADAASTFVPDIVKNVTALHDALDDDLTALALTPCAPMTCVMQAAPLVVPDTLQIDPGKPAGFPNGRALADPVVDITLAVVLLDLAKHPVDTFAKLPLNPPKNDKEFLAAFPYVADPH